MGEGDGVYYSGSAYTGSTAPARGRGGAAARRAKKAVVAVVGLGAIGGGAYFGVTLLSGAPDYLPDKPAAQAPLAPPTSTEPTTPPQPSPGPQQGTKSGVRQSALPSPTPSQPTLSDDEVAAAQVSRLLQASPAPPSPAGMAIESGPVTVSRQTGTDGSVIRIVAARYDLTGWWSAGDRGRAVGDARCTRRLRDDLDPAPRLRPTMLMCWRTGSGKSVVTVAVKPRDKPLDVASVDVLDREWDSLG